MTELKTLKDLQHEKYAGVTETCLLRREAIKWIKNYQAGIKYHESEYLNWAVTPVDKQAVINAHIGLVNWIKYFFNIEESDLA